MERSKGCPDSQIRCWWQKADHFLGLDSLGMGALPSPKYRGKGEAVIRLVRVFLNAKEDGYRSPRREDLSRLSPSNFCFTLHEAGPHSETKYTPGCFSPPFCYANSIWSCIEMSFCQIPTDKYMPAAALFSKNNVQWMGRQAPAYTTSLVSSYRPCCCIYCCQTAIADIFFFYSKWFINLGEYIKKDL